MRIIINGEEQNISLSEDKAFLSQALDSMGYKPNTIVVELNKLIISQKIYRNYLMWNFILH